MKSTNLFFGWFSAFFAILTLGTLPSALFAQSQLSIERFGTDEGLPHRWVKQIIQDEKGFLWVATQGGGLCRFDGHKFQQVLLVNEDIKIKTVESIQESKEGMIWVKYHEEKIAPIIFDPSTFQFKTAKRKTDFFTPNQAGAQTIHEPFLAYLPELKEVNFKPENAGDGMVDPERLKSILRGYKTYGTEPILIKKENQELWIWHNRDERGPKLIMAQQFTRFNLATRTWSAFHLNDFLKIKIANKNLPIDTEGKFWHPAFTEENNQPFAHFQLPKNISPKDWLGMRVDNQKNIWIYTRQYDLFRFDIITKELENFGKIDNERIEIYEDQEGTVWIGTENGLLKIRRGKRLFETCLNEPVALGKPLPFGKSISYILELKGGHIFANKGYSNLFQINPATLTNTSILGRTRSLIPVSENYFYVKEKKNRWMKIQADPLRIQYFKGDARRASADEGFAHKIPFGSEDRSELILLDTIKEELVFHDAMLSQEIGYSFFDRQQNRIYGNHEEGIIIIDLENNSKEYLKLWPQSDLNFIRAWLPEKDGIWLGTIEGLKRLDFATRQITENYTTEDGLPHNTIYSMVRDGKNFWLGTQNGLCCFNPETLDARNFYVEDGLTHNEFNTYSALLASDGRIWMGGLNGLNIFDPKKLEKIEEEVSKLMLTAFSKYNKNTDSTYVLENINALKKGTFTILPQETSFTFRFFLNSLFEPEKHRYFWYLEGYEPPWANVSDEPLATYRHVAPGRYILKVKATDSRGNPAADKLAIAIQVKKIWHLRWWAWVIYALLMGGAVFAFYRFKVSQKLAQQEAMRLKEMDEVKTKLYTNITHEFRTPLTVILGTTEQLTAKSPKLTAGKKEQLELKRKLSSVHRNGQNLLQLVNQMLDLSKLEAGKLSLSLVQADIVGYVRYIASSFHSFADMKDIELTFHSNLEKCMMDFDKDKMMNVVSNLLSNAIKFTPANGEVMVSISSTVGASSTNSALVIKIKDTGIGIPIEKIPHIFDRFYQVDDSHTRHGEGTGIGLTLVKELVDLIGGKISVESAEGVGTTFTVLLPVTNEAPLVVIEVDESPLPEPAVMALQIDLQTAPKNGDLPILLIVEDNADVAQYIQSCLENEYRTIYAADGQIGIQQAIEHIPDIIISDVMMPNVDGFELVQTLKKDERTSHIPIVLLTAKADEISKIKGLEQGADAYLSKPFNEKELRVRMEKLIELRRVLQRRHAATSTVSVQSADSTAFGKEDAFLKKTNAIIESHLSDSTFGAAILSKEIGLSESQLYRKLKAITGKSTAIYIRSIRLQRGMELLKTTDRNVSEVAYAVGFTNLSYFSRIFSEEFGAPPNESRN